MLVEGVDDLKESKLEYFTLESDLSIPGIVKVIENGGNHNAQITLLITGFGPFREHVVNSSWEAVKLMPDLGIRLPPNVDSKTNVKIIAYEIPVKYNCVARIIPKLWEKHRPDLVIHVGVSAIAKAITIEQYAHNCGYCAPDVDNCIPAGNVCVADGCDVLESGFDMKKIVDLMNSKNSQLHAEVSYDPGRYLCDFIYYNSLNVNKDRTAFIHVPPLLRPWKAEDLAMALSFCTTELMQQLFEKSEFVQSQSNYGNLGNQDLIDSSSKVREITGQFRQGEMTSNLI